MVEFEARQADTTDQPDDGWTKVGKKKTVRLTEADQIEMKARAARKRKKGELVSSYEYLENFKNYYFSSIFINFKFAREKRRRLYD